MNKVIITVVLLTLSIAIEGFSQDSMVPEVPCPPTFFVVPVELARTPTFQEAPAVDAKGHVYVSEPLGGRVTRITPEGETSVWAELEGPNGHKVLSDGTHLVCDYVRKAVLRLDSYGKVIGEAATTCGGKPLRAPNDIVLDSYGGFYFTDPVHEDLSRVAYVDSNGQSHLVMEYDGGPNGIALRPDGKVLYVADTDKNVILSLPVRSPGRVGPVNVFIRLPEREDGEPIGPDGLTLDDKGNLYVTQFGVGHIQIFDPQGKWIHSLPAGLRNPSNLTFGGPEGDQLYVTGSPGYHGLGVLYKLEVIKVKQSD